MSGCRLERRLDNASETLARAKNETAKFGGRMDGDLERGTYVVRTPLGTVEGTYTITGSTVRFDIEKKPPLVPCALISKVLDQFFGS